MAILSKKDAPKNITSHEKMLGENDFIVSKTDKKGNITYCNRIFISMSGYAHSDLIGSNHNLVRHPDVPKIAFKLAWDMIKNKKEFFGFVKNLRADGSFYWVYAYITADLDEHSNIIGYTSFRRKPAPHALKTIIPLYEKLVDIEKKSNTENSAKALYEILDKNKISYNEFVINLQKGL